MSRATGLEVAHLAATFLMAGVILLVQVVVYPMFASVGEADFAAYHRLHSARITRLVGPLILVELVSGLGRLWLAPSPLWWLCCALSAAAVALTGLWAVPLHARLAGGWHAGVHRRLMVCNAARCLVWAGHAGLLLAWLCSVMGGEGRAP